MKTLFALAALLSIFQANAFAAQVKGNEDVMINATQIDGHREIPRVGDLTGTVVSVYAGTAYALERYVVTVNNTAAPVEGDDYLAHQTFELTGTYSGPAQAVYSRKIDKNTYSIAIITTVLDVEGEDENGPARAKAKILLRVKFTKDGVAEVAEYGNESID